MRLRVVDTYHKVCSYIILFTIYNITTYFFEGLRAGSSLQMCILLSLDFLATQLERAMSYFNRYAFCFVALYGTDFITSSRWDMCAVCTVLCVKSCCVVVLVSKRFVVMTCCIRLVFSVIRVVFVYLLACCYVLYITLHCSALHNSTLHSIA